MDTGALMTQLKTRLGLPAAATYQTILDAVDNLLQAGTNQEVDQAVAAGRIHSSKRAWWRDKLNAEPAAARLALHSQPAGVIQHETGSHGTPEGTISRVCNALQITREQYDEAATNEVTVRGPGVALHQRPTGSDKASDATISRVCEQLGISREEYGKAAAKGL